MNFKPTLLKTIISICIVIVWYTLLNMAVVSPLCFPCPSTFNIANCEKVFTFELIPDMSCNCACPDPTSIIKIFADIFLIVIPGVLIYVFWSLIQKK